MWNDISKVLFLGCALVISSGINPSQTNDLLDSRLSNINLAMKAVRKESSKGASLNRSAEKAWEVLDGALTEYLDSHNNLRINKANQDLNTLLGSSLPFEKRGWTAAIVTHSTGDPHLCLAVYDDFYEMGLGMFTFRVLGRQDNTWKVVAKMDDSDSLEKLYLAHQEEMLAELKRIGGVHGETVNYHRRVLELLTQRSIHDMGITISSPSIHSLPSGGCEFVTVLTAVSTVAAESLVRWIWTPTQGLTILSWVWGDEWVYDPLIKESVAKWHNESGHENGKSVRLKDFK